MALQTAPDINLLITVPSLDGGVKPLVAAERRVTPSWTIQQLKAKLEPVTGIPATCQVLRTKLLNGQIVTLDQDDALVGDSRYGLRKGSEIEITDTRPPAARQNFNDVSSVEKYEMPVQQYEQLNDSVLAWKRRQKLGRFDPNAKSLEEMVSERRTMDSQAVKQNAIEVGKRCRVGREDARRGIVRFVGEIDGLGGEREAGCIWIGVELDEPLGKNNGTVKVEKDGQSSTRRMFECKDKFGVFARPEKVETGDFPPIDDLTDEDMEEL